MLSELLCIDEQLKGFLLMNENLVNTLLSIEDNFFKSKRHRPMWGAGRHMLFDKHPNTNRQHQYKHQDKRFKQHRENHQVPARNNTPVTFF